MGTRFLLARRCIFVALLALAASTAKAKADAPVKSWTVTGLVVDEVGKPVAEGSIGYPGEPEGRVQFEKMLRPGSKHLTDDEINNLIKTLEKNKY